MDTTPTLGLKQPGYDDFADIKDISDNMGEIDTAFAVLMAKIYPVGSIYMSVVNTNPGTLFGGTWEQLKDRFLLADGDTYSAGNTGGAASQSYTPGGSISGTALSVNQIPSHNHTFTGSSSTTSSNGGSHKHTVGAHSHGLGNHTHGLGSHVHGLNSHTHGLGSHVHGLNSHTHGLGDHVHTMAQSSDSGDAIYAKLSNSWERIGFKKVSVPTYASGNDKVLKIVGDHSSDYAALATSGNTGTASGNTGGPSSANTGAASGNTGAASGNTAAASGNTGAASGNTANSTAFDSGSTSIAHTHTVTAAGSIGNKGGGEAHNHTFAGTAATINTMPPYLTVYMWKRTA